MAEAIAVEYSKLLDEVRHVELQEGGKIIVTTSPKPTLEKGAVLLKTICSEVCGTDVHLRKGHLSSVPFPIIPGHVSVGEIDDLKGEIRDADGNVLKKGDVVTFLDVHETCHNCWNCLVGKTSTCCPKRKVYGITYSAREGLLGGWSEYIYLKPGVKIIKLPSTLDPRVFMAGGCGLPTAIHAIQRAHVKLGDTVVVQGSGPVGLMASILAKASGAFQVIVIGAPAARLQIAKEFGADEVISIEDVPDHYERIKIVKAFTNGRGADVTVEATGVPTAFTEGALMTRDAGTYVIVGHYTDVGEVPMNPHLHINSKHLNVVGSWGSDFSHFYLGVRFMDKFRTKYPWHRIISKEYRLDEAEQALNDVENLKVMKALIKP